MHSKTHITLLFLGWACFLLCTGCSSRVNTSSSRAYHEWTTRYNVYYNAEQAYNDILDDQLENFPEDYSKLLPFYPPLSTASKTTAGGPFDPVIDKTAKAIREHSISAKPRRDPSQPRSREYRQWLQQNEFNPFIHHAWLLMGKAHVQNGDHEQAIAVFNEVTRIFGQESDVALEARIWRTRAYIETGRLYEAEQAIYALNTARLSKHSKELLTGVHAQYLLESGQYENAIPFLKKAIESEKQFKQKKRLQFLLGQLYIVLGQAKQAHQAFNDLKGLSTPREFARNATEYQLALTANGDSLARGIQGYLPGTPLARLPSDTASIAFANRLFRDQLQGEELSDGTFREDHWDFFRSRWTRGNRFHYGSNRDEAVESELPLFSHKKDTSHVLLLLYEQGDEDKQQLLFAAARFNFDRYQLRTFRLAFVPLMEGEALSVYPFRSFEETSRYARAMATDSLFQANIPGRVTPLAISEENLNLLQRGASMGEYLAFFATAFEGEPASIKPEKAVSLTAVPIVAPIVAPEPVERYVPYPADSLYQPLAPDELKRQLEEKETRALRQTEETTTTKSREQLLRERERQRQEKVKQRERELRKRQREREAQLKQRERERQQRVKSTDRE